MQKKIILTGVGGQGTVLASKLMAAASLAKGYEVMSAETIGMAQKGGSVFSHLRVGEGLYSPMIRKGTADLLLAFADEADVDALHAAGREGGLYLFPEHGGELETDDSVEHAACLLGVDEVEVDVARMGEGVAHRRLGDFVKHYSLRGGRVEAEDFREVPGDGFSFAVFIRCEPDRVGLFGGRLQFLDHLLLVGGYLVDGREVAVDVHAHPFLAEIADMADARHDLIILAEKF